MRSILWRRMPLHIIRNRNLQFGDHIIRSGAHLSIWNVCTFYHGMRHTNESLIFKSVNLCRTNCYGLKNFFMSPCQWGNIIFLWIVEFSCNYTTFVNVLVDNHVRSMLWIYSLSKLFFKEGSDNSNLSQLSKPLFKVTEELQSNLGFFICYMAQLGCTAF